MTGTQTREEMPVSWIFDYYDSYAWIAEVTVPPCASRASELRAREAAQAALDVLKLFFGPRDGADFRLGDQRGKQERTAHLFRSQDGRFDYVLRSRGEGALAEPGWYDDMASAYVRVLEPAAAIVAEHLRPRNQRSDHQDRWLGALSWYGQAISEREPAAQIVKYVAALERLTVLEETGTSDAKGGRNVTDAVTSRSALLACDRQNPATLAQTLAATRELYKRRCDLMHGRSSPLTVELDQTIGAAHRLTQLAMLVALDIFAYLEASGRTKSQDLEDYYVSLEALLPQSGP